MADDPFFPQPRAKHSYREPAKRELVPDVPPEERAPKAEQEKPVITRPLHPEEMPPSVKKQPRLGRIAEEEQLFWRSHSLVARYPRAFAAVLTAIGGLSTWASVEHGGFYSRRALVGPPMLAAGLFPLLFGFPHHPTDGNPRWWKIGYGVTFGIGCLGGVLLVYFLTLGSTGFER